MKKAITILLSLSFFFLFLTSISAEKDTSVLLGNEVLLETKKDLITNNRVGLITNQSGVNSNGERLMDILYKDKDINLTALYSPEHGIEGIARAGEYVESYVHKEYNIPVYSLYGRTRKPTPNMLKNIDVLLFDMQDIGSRTYTYISTLNYCMIAAKENNVPIIVLDRPNPVGGMIVEGPILEDKYKSFVGIDNLPMAHGMTIGEIAYFFNRNIGAELKVIAMEGYTRDMIFQDTGIPWVQTSPNIPDIDSVFGYMATGLGEGTGIFQADQFKWIGGRGINSNEFAKLLNNSGLPGIAFIPEDRGSAGGVRLNILDYKTFNPARTGFYALAYAKSLNDFRVPKSGRQIVMFDKVMGTDRIGKYLEKNLAPELIVESYKDELENFKKERKNYLIEDYNPRDYPLIKVNGTTIGFDTVPFVNNDHRLMVPLRTISESIGAKVLWIGSERRIIIENDKDSITLKIDSKIAMVNERKIMMDTEPVIVNDRTMIPIRYVGELLGGNVN